MYGALNFRGPEPINLDHRGIGVSPNDQRTVIHDPRAVIIDLHSTTSALTCVNQLAVNIDAGQSTRSEKWIDDHLEWIVRGPMIVVPRPRVDAGRSLGGGTVGPRGMLVAVSEKRRFE